MNKQTIQKLGLLANKNLAIFLQEEQKKGEDLLSLLFFSNNQLNQEGSKCQK